MAGRHTLLAFVPMAGGILSAQAPPPGDYDPDLFQERIPASDLIFPRACAGMPVKEMLCDRQFHKLLKSIVPACTFHCGTDISFDSALARGAVPDPSGCRIVVRRERVNIVLAGGAGMHAIRR